MSSHRFIELRRSAALGVGAGVVASALLLAGPASVTVLAQTQDADPIGSIAVAGVGHAEVEPDQATVRLGVTVRGLTAEQATSRAAEVMSSVIASLEASGIEADDIQTTRLDLDRVIRRDPETGLRVPVGWAVQNRVRATIEEIERSGVIIDAAIAAGATDVESVEFFARDPSAAVAEAREEAVAAAALGASQLASAAGVEVGDVLSISEGSESIDSRAFRAEFFAGVTAGGRPPRSSRV
jgi:uncharacterized protein YggE